MTNCWHQALCCKHCRAHKIRRSHTHGCKPHLPNTHDHHTTPPPSSVHLQSAQGLPPHTTPHSVPSSPLSAPFSPVLWHGTHPQNTLYPFCGPAPAADDDAMSWHKAAPPTQGPMRAWHASLGLAGIPHARFALSPPLLFLLPLSLLTSTLFQSPRNVHPRAHIRCPALSPWPPAGPLLLYVCGSSFVRCEAHYSLCVFCSCV